MEKLSKKTKHDHTLTNILKFAIFSVIMLAPIFSVASRCLYVICNKNAKDSYSVKLPIDNINGANENYNFTASSLWLGIKSNGELYNNSGLNANLSYNANFDFKYNDNIFFIWKFSNITNLNTKTSIYSESTTYQSNNTNTYKTINNITYCYTIVNISYDHIPSTIYLYGNGNAINGELTNFGFFKVNDYYNTTPSSTTLFNKIYNHLDNFFLNGVANLETDKSANLDNAFEYSLSQIEESSYYNWATNLGIYTPIYNMVNGLGGHDIIALLLAYWSIYTAIYIVFDIIIACFVKITHLLQSE